MRLSESSATSGDSFYLASDESTESPPMTPTSARTSGRESASPRVPPAPQTTTFRGVSIELDLGGTDELSLSASFSPRSSKKKRPKSAARSARRRGAKKSPVLPGSTPPRSPKSPVSPAAISQQVLPQSVAEKVEQGTVDAAADPSKLGDVVRKAARAEYKALIKSTRPCRTWADKLKAFPSATSYFSFPKNRYRDVLADEATRVRLVGMEHDYINANYINGSDLPGCPKARFIACQAPLASTIEDFWYMVWQEKSAVIAMLTRLREKSVVKATPYWPKDVGNRSTYGMFEVLLSTQKALKGITISTLEVTKKTGQDAGTRVVYHLLYSEWPDFGVPKTSRSIRALVSYSNLYSDLGATQGLTGPIVSHCSAGIGRTGTFIAICVGIELLESHVLPDVAGIVRAMRACRSGMIQTDTQYLFVFEALNDHIYQFSHQSKRPHRMTSASSISILPLKGGKFCSSRNRSASAVIGNIDLDDEMDGAAGQNDNNNM